MIFDHAYFSLQIPQLLGDIVNVVARGGEATAGAEAVERFLAQIKEPALQMVKLYLAQSAMTFAYIYSLSCVGECHSYCLCDVYGNEMSKRNVVQSIA